VAKRRLRRTRKSFFRFLVIVQRTTENQSAPARQEQTDDSIAERFRNHGAYTPKGMRSVRRITVLPSSLCTRVWRVLRHARLMITNTKRYLFCRPFLISWPLRFVLRRAYTCIRRAFFRPRIFRRDPAHDGRQTQIIAEHGSRNDSGGRTPRNGTPRHVDVSEFSTFYETFTSTQTCGVYHGAP